MFFCATFAIALVLLVQHSAASLKVPAHVRKSSESSNMNRNSMLKSLGYALQMSGISCQSDASDGSNGTADVQCTLPSRDTMQRSEEYWIKREIFLNYDKSTRPVAMDRTPINCTIAMSLFHILDTNEKYQTVSALVSIRLRWRDEFLAWNATAYDNVSTIWVPSSSIWTPDIVVANSAEHYTEPMNMNAKVNSSGWVLWMYPSLLKVYCPLDVRLFPFDSQACNITFYSWTYSKEQIDLRLNELDVSAVYFNSTNQEWYVDAMTAIRDEKVYACCSERYPDITFTIHMRRRSLFYILSLIFPCVLIYFVSFLGFFLAPESGDKVHLEITILLALVVFLMIVGEVLPPSPDAVPVLGILYSVTMVMVSIALVFTVIVTNLHTRALQGQPVTKWLQTLVLYFRGDRKHNRFSVNNSRRINGTDRFAGPSAETYFGVDRRTQYSQDEDANGAAQCLLLSNHAACECDAVGNGHGNGAKANYAIVHRQSTIAGHHSLRQRTSLALSERKECEDSSVEVVTWLEVADLANTVFFWTFVVLSAFFVISLVFDIAKNTRAVLK